MDDKYDPRNILVIRLSALGDVVRTVPAVISVSEVFPEAKITWVTEPLGAAFLAGHPALERVIVFPKGMKGVGRLPAFFKELRSARYDLVLDFHGLFKSSLVCRAAKASRKVGYSRVGTKERTQFAYTETVDVPEGKLSRYTRNMALAAHLGGKEPDSKKLLPIPDEIVNKLSPFIEGLPDGGPVVTVHQGTRPIAVYKRWPRERYAHVADELVRRHNARVMLTWAPNEHDAVTEIANLATEAIHVAPRTETPLHLAYLLSRSDLFIGPDTGALHIATLAGTPVVAIFGPTDPIENEPGPYSPHEIVRTPVECSPCRKMACTVRSCMDAVQVGDVLAAAARLL